jgi:hypothetical protein
MRRLWSFTTAVFLAIWLGLTLVGSAALFRDPGTFWHVRLGAQTLTTGRVHDVDRFSFTQAGTPWVDAQWLPECLMALVYRAAGWDGLLLLTAAGLALVYALATARLTRHGWNPVAAIVLLMLVLVGSSHQFHVRPLVLTIGFLAWTYGLLIDVESGRRSARQLAWLVPLVVVWTNCHGGVLAGIGSLGLVVAGWWLQGFVGRASPANAWKSRLGTALLVVACVAAVLVNPYGIALPRTWMHVLGLPLPEMIQEHAPLDFTRSYAQLLALLAVLYMVALAAVPWRRWSAAWLLPLVWFALAVLRVRNAPLFAVTAMIGLADIVPQGRWVKWLEDHDWLRPPATRSAGSWLPPLVAAMLVAAVFLVQAAGVNMPVLGRGWVQLDAGHWPVDLQAELQAVEQSDNPRVCNDMLFGGYLILHNPRIAVFIDDRCELYGRQRLLEYHRSELHAPELLNQWQQRYGFGHVLAANDSAWDIYLKSDARWSVVRRGQAAVLYRRGPS